MGSLKTIITRFEFYTQYKVGAYWHTPKIATGDIAFAESYIAKSSGYHHHHVGDYDYVEDIDEDGYNQK